MKNIYLIFKTMDSTEKRMFAEYKYILAEYLQGTRSVDAERGNRVPVLYRYVSEQLFKISLCVPALQVA